MAVLLNPQKQVAQLPETVTPPPPTELGVRTPLWWVYRLTHRLQREVVGYYRLDPDGVYVQQEGLARLRRYYEGHFDLPWVRDKDIGDAYLALLNKSRSNFLRLVADVAAERSQVLGLRLPGNNETADSETWDIWLRNGLDETSPAAFAHAIVERRAYLSVWWDQRDNSRARIAVEDPQQCWVEYEPGDNRRRAAGIKTWLDDWTGRRMATLYLPDAIHYFEWRGADDKRPSGWYPRRDPERNRLRVVPLVPMRNKPSIRDEGYSQIEDLLPVQDRINQTLFNRQIAEHLTAFRQKWATGLELPEDEEGNPIVDWQASITSIWLADGATDGHPPRFGEFSATDLTQYHKTIEQELEHLSVISRTPRHVFLHQGQAPSGDAMKSDEAGLVAKVHAMWPSFGASIREALTLARQIEGLTTPMGSEIVWADPEWQTFAQLVDGHAKLVEARIESLDYAREKLGMTPAAIARVKREIEQDAMLLEAAQLEVAPDGETPAA